MMKMIAGILILFFSFSLIAFVIGLCAMCAASDDATRLMDDTEQVSYIREWKKKKNSR